MGFSINIVPEIKPFEVPYNSFTKVPSLSFAFKVVDIKFEIKY